jgi:hypothetical protein
MIMKKNQKSGRDLGVGTKIPGVVHHPRYGDTVFPTQWASTTRKIRRSFFGYQDEQIFPESSIPADVSRQNYTVMPRRYYVDILKQCRSCQRPFIFFAREQQHWYEDLGFFIEADCVCCVECRKSEQRLRSRFNRYSYAINSKNLDDKQLATLAEDAVFLFHAGLLRDEQVMRRLRNLARGRIPDNPATRSIEVAMKRDVVNPEKLNAI